MIILKITNKIGSRKSYTTLIVKYNMQNLSYRKTEDFLTKSELRLYLTIQKLMNYNEKSYDTKYFNNLEMTNFLKFA